MLVKTGCIDQARLWKKATPLLRKFIKEVLDRSSTSEPRNVDVVMIGIQSFWCKLSYRTFLPSYSYSSIIPVFVLLLTTNSHLSKVWCLPVSILSWKISAHHIFIEGGNSVGHWSGAEQKKPGTGIKGWNTINKPFGSLNRPSLKEKVVPCHNCSFLFQERLPVQPLFAKFSYI